MRLGTSFNNINKFHHLLIRRRSIPVNSNSPISLIRSSSSSSSSTSLNILSEGSRVELNDGRKGIILSKTSNGWWCLQLDSPDGTQEEIKVRRKAITEIINIDNNNYNDINYNIQIQDTYNTNTIDNTIVDNTLKNVDVDEISLNAIKIQAPPLHKSTSDWIIFSDLHVKSATIDTCEQVLNHVHNEAVKYNAGIIFLGDFWHVSN